LGFINTGEVEVLRCHRYLERADQLKFSGRQFLQHLTNLTDRNSFVSPDQIAECQREGQPLPRDPVVANFAQSVGGLERIRDKIGI